MQARLVQFCPSCSARRRWWWSPLQERIAAHDAEFPIENAAAALWNQEVFEATRARAVQADTQIVSGSLEILDEQLQIPRELAQEYLLKATQTDQPEVQFRIAGRMQREPRCGGHAEPSEQSLLHAAPDPLGQANITSLREVLADRSNLDSVFARQLPRQLLSEAGESESIYALKHAAAHSSGTETLQIEDAARTADRAGWRRCTPRADGGYAALAAAQVRARDNSNEHGVERDLLALSAVTR